MTRGTNILTTRPPPPHLPVYTPGLSLDHLPNVDMYVYVTEPPHYKGRRGSPERLARKRRSDRQERRASTYAQLEEQPRLELFMEPCTVARGPSTSEPVSLFSRELLQARPSVSRLFASSDRKTFPSTFLYRFFFSGSSGARITLRSPRPSHLHMDASSLAFRHAHFSA